jgi:hypothetical protein
MCISVNRQINFGPSERLNSKHQTQLSFICSQKREATEVGSVITFVEEPNN